jgi:hypothetical protein
MSHTLPDLRDPKFTASELFAIRDLVAAKRSALQMNRDAAPFMVPTDSEIDYVATLSRIEIRIALMMHSPMGSE